MRMIDAVRRSIPNFFLAMSFCLLMGMVAGQDKKSLAPTRVEDGAPSWLKTYPCKKKFTFVRLRYDQRAGGRWATDYPDAEVNLSIRLKQLTELDVSVDGLVLAPDDPRLVDYSFAYLSANGSWTLSDPQVAGLRRYLESGGFLMIDDSWGEDEKKNAITQMRRVLPNREPQELPLDHIIFHCVFDLEEKPQVWSIHAAVHGRAKGINWELPGGLEVSYQGIKDDAGRLMVLICHNTDLADGWERVDDDGWYAQEFSEKRAFPTGVNIVFYALTTSD